MQADADGVFRHYSFAQETTNGCEPSFALAAYLAWRDTKWEDVSGANTDLTKAGKLPIDFGKAWIKSPKLTAGQVPIMRYNRDLMMAILWDRMPYLSAMLNTESISLEQALEAYATFSEGSPKKFVIDPHGSVK